MLRIETELLEKYLRNAKMSQKWQLDAKSECQNASKQWKFEMRDRETSEPPNNNNNTNQ